MLHAFSDRCSSKVIRTYCIARKNATIVYSYFRFVDDTSFQILATISYMYATRHVVAIYTECIKKVDNFKTALNFAMRLEA